MLVRPAMSDPLVRGKMLTRPRIAKKRQRQGVGRLLHHHHGRSTRNTRIFSSASRLSGKAKPQSSSALFACSIL
ncbi:hypothetical protein LIA77_09705 [Sarocladium implicatum]|nr:hypothetical protein LIA77_09705 [Sarocladium implicatum]